MKLNVFFLVLLLTASPFFSARASDFWLKSLIMNLSHQQGNIEIKNLSWEGQKIHLSLEDKDLELTRNDTHWKLQDHESLRMSFPYKQWSFLEKLRQATLSIEEMTFSAQKSFLSQSDLSFQQEEESFDLSSFRFSCDGNILENMKECLTHARIRWKELRITKGNDIINATILKNFRWNFNQSKFVLSTLIKEVVTLPLLIEGSYSYHTEKGLILNIEKAVSNGISLRSELIKYLSKQNFSFMQVQGRQVCLNF